MSDNNNNSDHNVFSDEDDAAAAAADTPPATADAPAPGPAPAPAAADNDDDDNQDDDDDDGYAEIARDLQRTDDDGGGGGGGAEERDDGDDNDTAAGRHADKDADKDAGGEGGESGGSSRRARRDEDDDEQDNDDDDDDDEDEDREEEDDDDEEEEDYEEDDDLPRAKKRRRKVNRFIEAEAMVDDDEEEEEDEEEGFVEDREEDLEELQKAADTRAHRELDSRRADADEMDAEKIAETMKARYGRSEFNRGQYRGDVEHIPQSMLMPSVSDPKLWICACREGKEKEAVFAIMNRVFEREGTANALDIYSIFHRDSLKGYIYIEARQQGVVQNALDGLNNIYLSKLRLVPVNEMVDCLTIKAKDTNLDKIHWFRAKKGKYAGDLGQVVQITDNGEAMLCRFVPRLDPAGTPKVPFGGKRKKTERPPAKLFNPLDFKNDVRKEGDYYIYNGDYFDKEGYLEKVLKLSSLDVTNIHPTLEEISQFSGGSTDKPDLSYVEGAGSAVATDFQIGENVEIISGAMAGISGSVASIHNDLVAIKPHFAKDLPPTVTITARELRKQFKQGDHVQVVKGNYKGETGLIVIIKDNIVTLVSDGTSKPVEVLSTSLRTTADVGVVAPRTSPYDVGDLVFLQNDVAVVTTIEGEYFGILSQFGSHSKVKAREISNKRDSKNAIANDAHGNPISAGSAVDVLDPDRHDVRKSGTVAHIFRQVCFVKAKDTPEHGGYVVAKTHNVVSTGIKRPMQNSYQSTFGSAPRGGGFGGPPRSGGFGGGGGGRGRGSFHPMIGKTITIAVGAFKGYVGIIKDVNDGLARVELHTASRVVTVDVNKCLLPGQTLAPNANNNNSGFGSSSNSYGFGADRYGQTPMHGAKTPMHGGRTPFGAGGRTPGGDGGRTPAWDLGGRTPAAAWDAGSKTPGHWDASSKTPHWDAGGGGKTPAWDAGAKTPAWSGAAGGKTPAWDSGSRTPYAPMDTASSVYPHPASAVTSTIVPTGGNYADIITAPLAASTITQEWPAIRVLVTLTTPTDPPNQEAIITAVQPAARTVSLELLPTHEVRSGVSFDDIKPVSPDSPKDKVIVLSGENAGQTGEVISAEDDDGVVRMEVTREIKIFTLNLIAKYVPAA
ncbi:transcription elongation factor spt5 [Geranomyces michiganensis]|nr:transcription elongation factor spt5 [Geranomyces michiganensis]